MWVSDPDRFPEDCPRCGSWLEPLRWMGGGRRYTKRLLLCVRCKLIRA